MGKRHCLKAVRSLEEKKIDPFRQNLRGSTGPFPESIKFFVMGAMSVSASAKRRGITPQLFTAWGRTQERSVTACPIRPRVFSCPQASGF